MEVTSAGNEIGIGTAIVMTIISVGIDLGTFRLAFLQWLYVGLVVSLIVLASNLDIDTGMQRSEKGFHILPLSLIADGGLQRDTGIVLLSGGLILNYLIFLNSDSYTG